MEYVIKFNVLNFGCGIYEKTITITAESRKEAMQQVTNRFLVTEIINVSKIFRG